MKDDTISRQAALTALNGLTDIFLNNLPPTIYKADAVEAVKALPPAQPGWIPTSERTPEKSGNYLVTTPDGQVELRYYSTLYRWYGWVDMVAWMPLPLKWEGDANG